MINAGALVAASLVHGEGRDEKVERIVERLRIYAGNPNLHVDEETLANELRSNDRNLGLSYIMRSLGMMDGDLEENIAVYLSICSVKVTARDLANMAATLAYGGVNPLTGERALSRTILRDVVTVITMCGMYNAAGEWAYDVGIPAKSGVSGGILAFRPELLRGSIFLARPRRARQQRSGNKHVPRPLDPLRTPHLRRPRRSDVRTHGAGGAATRAVRSVELERRASAGSRPGLGRVV
jgi:glutaminase